MKTTSDMQTVVTALGAMTDEEFVNCYEWVGNGWPVMTGPRVVDSYFGDNGEP